MSSEPFGRQAPRSSKGCAAERYPQRCCPCAFARHHLTTLSCVKASPSIVHDVGYLLSRERRSGIRLNEADTCRTYVVPRLQAAGWDNAPHSITEQRSFTDGRIVVAGTKTARRRQKRADYLLRYARDVPIAVVEAKADYLAPGQGLGQAKDYAKTLDLKFAYSTNGHGIVEFDFLSGTEKSLATFPTPGELWRRLKTTQGITDAQESHVLTPGFHSPGRPSALLSAL